MSNELEPVPVRCGCGGEAEVYSMGNNKLMAYYIQCEDCGTKTSMFRTITEATRVWNKAMSAKDIEIKDRTARVEKIDTSSKTSVVYKCLNCGQYTHRTSYSSPVNFCTNCGAKLEWE